MSKGMSAEGFSENEKLILYLFAFERDTRRPSDFSWLLRSRFGKGVSVAELERICSRLAARGHIERLASGSSGSGSLYRFSGLSFGDARRILADAASNGWLLPDSASERVLLALMEGGRGFRLSQNFRWFHDELWSAVIRFADFLRDGDGPPEMCFPPTTPDLVFRILASVLFCNGIDVTPVLSDWRVKRQQEGWFPKDDVYEPIEFAALCVWTGHLDWLEMFGKHENPAVVDSFVKACVACGKGELAEAYGLTATMVDLVDRGRENYAETLVSMPASHLLALAITAFHKPARTRLARLAAKLCPLKASFSYSLPDAAQWYLRKRLEAAVGLVEMAGGFHAGENEWLDPFSSSGEVFEVLTSGRDRQEIEEAAPEAFRLAAWAAAAKMPTIAGMYLSVFGWAFKGETAARAKKLAAAVAAAGCVWFRPFDADAGTWKLVVEAFDKCLPDAKKGAAGKDAGKAKSGRIVWAATLRISVGSDWGDDEQIEEDDTCVCSGLTPCFRGARAADDGSEDKPVTFKALVSGKYEGILTDVDHAVFKALQKADCTGRFQSDIPAAALEALCGHDCVTLATSEGDGRKKQTSYAPIGLKRKDVPLSVRSKPDGGLAVTVEPWCLKVIEDYAIRKVSDGRYAWYPFPKAMRAAMDVFKSFGANGTIEIPKEGMGAMRPILPRMATLAPIQGDLAAVGGGEGLERVAGAATPLVRLVFEDGVLSFSLRAKPLDDVELLFVPGAGQPERMVSRRKGMAVLVRDLEAEKTSAARVRKALDDFETWSDGADGWRIDSLLHALKALSVLKDLGGAVRLEWRKGRRIAIAAPKPGAWKLSATGGADFWFSVGGEFMLDDGRMFALSDLIVAFRNRQGDFVPFGDGEYVRLTSTLSKRLEALDAAGRVKGKSLEVPPAAIPMLDGVFGGDDDPAMALPQAMAARAGAIRAAFARKVEPPPRLKAELRPYQRDGYEWLSRLAACGLGACLADDMGLGKTVQVIALLLERSHDGASLVVAPASVCGNWRSELARFAPTLRVFMAWDEKADAMDAVNAAGPGDVVIAGYGLVVTREAQFAARGWNGVVLDEAQAIKNEASKRAKAVKRLKARFRVAATGTPVENRLTELWSISDFLNPGLLGTIGDFARRFTVEGRATQSLKRLVSPLVMRRVKRDVLDDLPDKTEITLPVILGEEERAGYETCRRMALKALEDGGAENRISILAELTRLRRYCCHPSLVLGEAGSVSAKMDALVDLLDNLRENHHRALVFSQFTDYLAIVRKAIDGQGWTHQYLDGQTPAAERARLVEAFQRGEGDFFLISLKAGGMGLNLTAANYVILLDPWWNPAVENQAADRVHRIGQKNPVTVYRLIAQDTVEERVLDLHKEKKAIAEDVLDGASSSALTPDELMKLFG